MTYHNKEDLNWNLVLIGSVLNIMTEGSLKIFLCINTSIFILTKVEGDWGVNFDKLLKPHNSHGKLKTLIQEKSTDRDYQKIYGNGVIEMFLEKPQASKGWIHGAFFVLDPEFTITLKVVQCSGKKNLWKT